MSSDFGRHALGHLTRSMYALHDRQRFEIFGYALAGDDGSDNFLGLEQDVRLDKVGDARFGGPGFDPPAQRRIVARHRAAQLVARFFQASSRR